MIYPFQYASLNLFGNWQILIVDIGFKVCPNNTISVVPSVTFSTDILWTLKIKQAIYNLSNVFK